MTILLTDLEEILAADVPARNGVPTGGQVTQSIKDAVALFNRRASRVAVTTVAVTAGVADYNLPADFWKLISLRPIVSNDGAVGFATSGKLVPIPRTSAPWADERHVIVGLVLTIIPTPTVTLDRELRYGAGLVLDDDGDYLDMTDEQAVIVMLKARAIALGLQATAASREAFQYSFGDARISKEKLATELRAQADVFDRQFDQAVIAYIGHVVVVG